MARTLGDLSSTNQVAVQGRRVAIGATTALGRWVANLSAATASGAGTIMQSLARDLSLWPDPAGRRPPTLLQAFVPELGRLRRNHTADVRRAFGQQLELLVKFRARGGAMAAA